VRRLTLDRPWEDRPIATPLSAGPVSSLSRTWEVVVALARADVRIRYGRGPIRPLKWIMDPIAALGVYLLLIVFVIDDEGRAAGLSIACAVVPFQLVIMTVANSLRAVELRRAIVSNMAFPRSLIPVAATLTETVGFAACLVLLPVMMVAYGVALTPAVLLMPLALALTFALALALSYPATLVGLWVPELSLMLVSATRTLFFVAPGLVALDEIGGRTHDLLKINPLTGIFETYRSILIDGAAPAAWAVLVPLGYAAVLSALFVPLFRREQRHFAKLLM
jgi:lipopolysaccharide transport system permease protein